LNGALPAAEVGVVLDLKWGFQAGSAIPVHTHDVEGAGQMFLEAGIQYDIVDPTRSAIDGYKTLILTDGLRIDTDLRAKLQAFMAARGKLVVCGTAALGSNGFDLDGVPVSYLEPAPTMPSYLRLDEALAGNTELATNYDYAFYEQSHLVKPVAGATVHGEIRRALFNRTWEHFTSHAHAPVGERLNAPITVQKENILYLAAPLFSAYRNHDYWAYRAIAMNALRDFILPASVKVNGPGWLEVTLHNQSQATDHPARRVMHLVAYHPRRSLQPIQHVDQSWAVSGISVSVRGPAPQRVYLAPDCQPLPFAQDGDYTRIDLPPIGAHTVVVLE